MRRKRPAWLRWLVPAVLLALAAGAVAFMADAPTRAERERIAAQLEQALQRCRALPEAQAHRCRLQAEGQQKIDVAALDARHHPSGNNRYKADAARVDLDYELALLQCRQQAEAPGKHPERAKALAQCKEQARARHQRALHEAQKQAAQSASLAEPPKGRAVREREEAPETALRKCDSLLGEANLQCMRELPPEVAKRKDGAAP
ncbi:MAG: hypothetical protein ACN6O3_16810 [Comamonas sp.]